MPADRILHLVLEPPVVAIVVALGFLAAGVRAYERAASSPVTIAVVASLAALASAGRVAFAFIPNVQPTTFIVATTGIVLGPAQGYMVGVLSVLASNVFLGHGPWTAWQMAAWGAAGASAGVLGILVRDVNRRRLALFLGVWGFLFGLIMNVWHWLSFTFPLSLKTLVVVEAAGLWFDAMHAAGNVVFALIFGDHMLKTLRRFARRLTYIVSVALLLALPLASFARPFQAPRPAQAAPPAAPEDMERAITRGIAYLRSCQNPDGGFPAAPGGHSSEMVTSWVVMAIRSTGLDPTSGDWKRDAGSCAGFLLNTSGFADCSTAPSTDIARRVLALRALGTDAHERAIAPLTRILASRQKADGRFEGEGEEGLLNAHFWSIIGLSSGVTAAMDRASALRFLLSQSNSDGGFGFASGLPSDPDDTAAAIQAMV
ncbi:MAG: prenyltransferase/squalene oxidase repeat-containing protein, partial [Bacillota bacterium]